MSSPEQRHAPIKDMLQKMEAVSGKDVEKSWKERAFLLNGKNVKLFGVAHHPKTLEIPEYKEKLQYAIAESSAVWSEVRPDFGDVSFEKFAKLAREFGVDVTDEELQLIFTKTVIENPFLDFFKTIFEMAAKEGKPIVHADPDKDIYTSFLLQHQDLLSEKVKIGLFLASIGVVGTKRVIENAVAVIDEVFQRRQQSVQSPRLSRRKFLKKTAMTAVGMGVLSTTSLGATVAESLGKDRMDNPLAMVLYTMDDYREVVVGAGMDQMTKDLEGEKPLVAVYGAKHISGIEHYAVHSKERMLRGVAYKLFSDQSKGTLSSFMFRDGMWLLDNEETING